MTFEGMTVKDIQRHIDALKVRVAHAKTDMEAIRARRQIREAETAILRSTGANLRENNGRVGRQMISRKRPTAAQKHWHDWLRKQDCAICGRLCAIHHAVGSTGRHGKLEIGQWWVNNLCYDHHQGTGGIHGDLSAFDLWDVAALGETRKEIEKSIFEMFSAKYERETCREIPAEVKLAIMEYHK